MLESFVRAAFEVSKEQIERKMSSSTLSCFFKFLVSMLLSRSIHLRAGYVQLILRIWPDGQTLLNWLISSS